MSKKTLLLIHGVLSREKLQGLVVDFGDGTTFCSYSPGVTESLVKGNVPYVNLDDGADIDDLNHIKEISLLCLHDVYSILKKKYLENYSDVNLDFFLSSYHYNYYLNVFLNTHLVSYFQIKSLLVSGCYDQLVDFRSVAQDESFAGFFNGSVKNRPLLGIRQACVDVGIKYVCIVRDSVHGNNNFFCRLDVGRAVEKSLGFLFRLKERIVTRRNVDLGKKGVVLALNTYDMPYLKERIEAGYGVRVVSDISGYRDARGKYVNEIDGFGGFKDLLEGVRFKYCNSFEVESLIKEIILCFFEYFQVEFAKFINFLHKKNHNIEKLIIVCAPVVNIDCVYLVAAYRYFGAKVIGWQHGGNYGYMDLPIFLHHDLLNCDIFLAYGDCVKRYYDKEYKKVAELYFDSCKDVEVIGSYRIASQELRERRRVINYERKVKILYPCRDYQKNILHLANGFVVTALQYFDIQKNVISTLSAIDGVEVVVRPHPGDDKDDIDALERWFQENALSNVCIQRDRKFMDVVKCSDIIVLDFPSTTFLEVISMGVKIIIFQPKGIYSLQSDLFHSCKHVQVAHSLFALGEIVESMKYQYDFLFACCPVESNPFILNAQDREAREKRVLSSLFGR